MLDRPFSHLYSCSFVLDLGFKAVNYQFNSQWSVLLKFRIFFCLRSFISSFKLQHNLMGLLNHGGKLLTMKFEPQISTTLEICGSYRLHQTYGTLHHGNMTVQKVDPLQKLQFYGSMKTNGPNQRLSKNWRV